MIYFSGSYTLEGHSLHWKLYAPVMSYFSGLTMLPGSEIHTHHGLDYLDP